MQVYYRKYDNGNRLEFKRTFEMAIQKPLRRNIETNRELMKIVGQSMYHAAAEGNYDELIEELYYSDNTSCDLCLLEDESYNTVGCYMCNYFLCNECVDYIITGWDDAKAEHVAAICTKMCYLMPILAASLNRDTTGVIARVFKRIHYVPLIQ